MSDADSIPGVYSVPSRMLPKSEIDTMFLDTTCLARFPRHLLTSGLTSEYHVAKLVDGKSDTNRIAIYSALH